MVIVSLLGGLGNQLFQHAFGQRLAAQWRVPLVVDGFLLSSRWLAAVRHYTPRPYELGVFGIEPPTTSPANLMRATVPFVSDTYLLRETADLKMILANPRPPARRVFCLGYWQSESYVKPAELTVREQFTFRQTPSAYSRRIADQIAAVPNPVFVHVRRGDYVSNANASQYHGFCGKDYYRRAIAHLHDRVMNAHFFVFSDDLPWVTRELGDVLGPATYVDGNTGPDSWQDMQLMSRCRHAIVANSSFSWWGAWLNPEPDRVVIAPRNWFAANPANTPLPDRWTAL